jgi:uncharacterized protein (TIGR03084 family)
MSDPMAELLKDFIAERADLDGLLAGLPGDLWDVESPAQGWRLRDCVSHLAEMDERAAAVTQPALQPPERGPRRPGSLLTPTQHWARTLTPAEVLAFFRRSGESLIAALRALKGDERLPWAGPPMSSRSFLTARLMEYWSHGLDIHDAAEVPPVDTDRLRHVAHLGYITRGFSYRTRGLEPPSTPLYVELTSPSGETWRWGEPDAPDQVRGPAGDFCRVVTQRINYLDTALETRGEAAREFLVVAQAFAGPAGAGRPPKRGA